MGQKTVNPEVERQARSLAKDSREAAADIQRVLWFPDDHEVRLVEVTEETPIYMEEGLYPFYFRPSPEDDLPLPTAVVTIRPDEIGKFAPPKGWGTWDDAVEL